MANAPLVSVFEGVSSFPSARFGLQYLGSKKIRPDTILFDTQRGDVATQLHAKADGNAIFVIAETDINETFVGYQTLFDTAPGNYKVDNNAWVALCSGKTVYVPNPSQRTNDVYCNGTHAPSWGGGHCLYLGATASNLDGSAARDHPTYIRHLGTAPLPGPFKITRLVIFKAVEQQLCTFDRLRCMWNSDEAKAFETMYNRTTKDDVDPPHLHLTSTSEEELRGILSQINCMRVAVVSKLEVLQALEKVTFANHEEKNIFIGRLRLTIQPVPPAAMIVNVLRQLMPHAACVEIDKCETKDDVVVLAALLCSAPITLTHIEVVENTKLDDDMLQELTKPNTDLQHDIELYFRTRPKDGVHPRIFEKIALSCVKVKRHWEESVPDVFPKIPTFPVTINETCQSSALKDQVGFTVHDIKQPMMHVPCARAKAKQYCKLFTEMEWKDGEQWLCSPHPECVPAAEYVQHLVAYLESVATDDACTKEDETKYRILAREEDFLKLMCPDVKDSVDVFKRVSQLIMFASFLNIPCLRRLLRSFLVRRCVKDSKLLWFIADGVEF